ncbi:hypothetical protein [Nonomuraea bangladeshensis]|uniref:hypothetical protein n=1 Tax=Nonomuraea bangladeshensis TaxID=404385 RepID=UPI0031CEDD97
MAVVMVCLLAGADRVGPQVRYYVAQGLRVGYPAGWQVDVDAELRPPMAMTAEPPWWPFGWFAEYQVSLLPHGASLEEAVEEHLKDVRDVYHDVVLEERERVVVGTGAPGYMLRSSYVEYASDMESFPTGEIVLLAVAGRGQLLKVRYVCALQRCGFEDVSIRAVMKSMVPM